MRLCMFHPLEQPMERGWPGRIDGEHVVQLAAQTLQAFFTGGGTAREHAVYPLAGVRLLAPVLHPPAVRVFDEQEAFAFANPAAIRSPGTRAAEREAPSDTVSRRGFVVLPRLVAVVGAEEEIGGYTVLAEWRDPRRAPPKDRDFALVLGPLVVTPDELEPNGLAAVVRVGGAETLRSRFDGLDWAAARDLAVDRTMLHPGDLLAGPPLGVAEVSAPGPVEVDVAGIGVLDATVAA